MALFFRDCQAHLAEMAFLDNLDLQALQDPQALAEWVGDTHLSVVIPPIHGKCAFNNHSNLFFFLLTELRSSAVLRLWWKVCWYVCSWPHGKCRQFSSDWRVSKEGCRFNVKKESGGNRAYAYAQGPSSWFLKMVTLSMDGSINKLDLSDACATCSH